MWRVALAASAVRTFHKKKAELKGEYRDLGCRLETIGSKVRENPGQAAEHHAELESIIARLTAMIAKDQPEASAKVGHRTQGRRKEARNNRTARRKRNYAIVQNLARRNMKQLADIVAEDRLEELEESRTPPPPKAEVEKLYSDLWGVGDETSFPADWGRKVEPVESVVLVPPIQLEAVLRRYQSLKAKTAAGFDGIGKKDLNPQALILLTIIFNICLAALYFPIAWSNNRTTLLPKAGKDHSKVANWRPVTIGSVISRLFSGIIDASLRQNVKFCYRQKGFTSESGILTTLQHCNRPSPR